MAGTEWIPRPPRFVIRVWDTRTWESTDLHRRSNHSGVAFDPTGTKLATTDGVYDVRSRKRLLKAEFASFRLQWSPKDPLLAGTESNDQSIRIRDAETGHHLIALKLTKKCVQDFAFSPDGAYLVAVSNEETVRIWRTRDWMECPSFSWGSGKLKCLAFAPDGARVACGSHRGSILIWDWDL